MLRTGSHQGKSPRESFHQLPAPSACIRPWLLRSLHCPWGRCCTISSVASSFLHDSWLFRLTLKLTVALLGFFLFAAGGGGGRCGSATPSSPLITLMSRVDSRRFSLLPAARCLKSPKREKRFFLPVSSFWSVILVTVLVVKGEKRPENRRNMVCVR